MKKTRMVGISVPYDLAEAVKNLADRSDLNISNIYSASVFKTLVDIDFENGNTETACRSALRMRSIVGIFYNPKYSDFLKRKTPLVENEKEDWIELDNILNQAHDLNPEGKTAIF